MPNDLGKKYSIWRVCLILGMCMWPFVGTFFIIGNALVSAGAGTQADIAYTLQTYYVVAVVFAEVLAISMFYFAKSLFKEGKSKQAITALKIPYLYILLLAVFYVSVNVFQ